MSEASPGRVARHARVFGRVQGVFFRASSAREAERLGLAGWVRNLPDGSVELWYEGPPEAVEAFERWLQVGPPLARVDRLEIEPSAPRGTDEGFRIRR
ncbi:MAG: acylphosphatase [Planctomycetota bacterium]|nr:MAG: acylphosphatase [Planctomycetota bacterium]